MAETAGAMAVMGSVVAVGVETAMVAAKGAQGVRMAETAAGAEVAVKAAAVTGSSHPLRQTAAPAARC